MEFLRENDCVFFIVDIQDKLLNAVFNKDILEKKSEIIAKASNILNIPVLITEQYPQGLGSTVLSIKDNIFDNATYYEKTFFNALEVEDLVKDLINLNRKQVVLMGIETHICVYQTAVALLNSGFDVTLVRDACGSRDEAEYSSAIELLKILGVKIKSTEMVLFELIKGAKHPRFKEIQGLIK